MKNIWTLMLACCLLAACRPQAPKPAEAAPFAADSAAAEPLPPAVRIADTKYEETTGRRLPSVMRLEVSQGGQLIQNIDHAFRWDDEPVNPEDAGKITYRDVNFDNKPDLLISLGSYGNQGVQYYDCYLWDSALHRFAPEPTFRDIGNPLVSEKYRCIVSRQRVSAAEYAWRLYVYANRRFELTEMASVEYDVHQSTFYSLWRVQGGSLNPLLEHVAQDRLPAKWKELVQL